MHANHRHPACLAALLTAAVAATLAAGVLPAQEQPAAPEFDPAAWQEYLASIEPGPRHQHLLDMVGRWSTVQKMWMGPGEPETTEGACEYVAILGGRYIQGRYTSTFMGQPFEGFSIDGYDNHQGRYFSLWLDSMGTGYFLAHGQGSEDGKRMEHAGAMYDPMQGKEIRSRSLTEVLDRDTVRFTMWHQADGDGQEIKAMEIIYRRQP